MKNLMLSTALAAGLGALSLAPASAAMIGKAPVAAAPAITDVACRTVEKTTMRNGVRKTVTSRECDGDRYERDHDRRYIDRREYRDERPGISLQLPR
ncbi:hypothetical protein ACFQI3_06545 [Hansschlegelia quercus]|uniref:Uncharacterized protein n=1 Tax=Hansschlegelia quercus TaxID=2528245 RepID=A0A4Q9GHW7_9HYPH|nr:hypothetical protein [Hansschlegelia quercus]TBN53789.1 hypothetical protein EYR15_08295 [Hansschlegelia quercus]